MGVGLVHSDAVRAVYGVPAGETRVIATGLYAGKRETHEYAGVCNSAAAAAAPASPLPILTSPRAGRRAGQQDAARALGRRLHDPARVDLLGRRGGQDLPWGAAAPPPLLHARPRGGASEGDWGAEGSRGGCAGGRHWRPVRHCTCTCHPCFPSPPQDKAIAQFKRSAAANRDRVTYVVVPGDEDGVLAHFQVRRGRGACTSKCAGGGEHPHRHSSPSGTLKLHHSSHRGTHPHPHPTLRPCRS